MVAASRGAPSLSRPGVASAAGKARGLPGRVGSLAGAWEFYLFIISPSGCWWFFVFFFNLFLEIAFDFGFCSRVRLLVSLPEGSAGCGARSPPCRGEPSLSRPLPAPERFPAEKRPGTPGMVSNRELREKRRRVHAKAGFRPGACTPKLRFSVKPVF